MKKPNYFQVLAASENPGTNEESDKWLIKVLIILEILIVTFLAGFIPHMIALGRPPTSIEEIWVPICSALLLALYAYARVRNIDMPQGEDEP